MRQSRADTSDQFLEEKFHKSTKRKLALILSSHSIKLVQLYVDLCKSKHMRLYNPEAKEKGKSTTSKRKETLYLHPRVNYRLRLLGRLFSCLLPDQVQRRTLSDPLNLIRRQSM